MKLNKKRLQKFCSGGDLRKTRQGRKHRFTSRKHPLHVVFKANRFSPAFVGLRNPRHYREICLVMRRYSKKFKVRVAQFSIQADHIHCLIRAKNRKNFLHFLRVFAGQVAQKNWNRWDPSTSRRRAKTKAARRYHQAQLRERFWQDRPYTRIVFGEKAIRIVRNYIQLNEKEATGEIPYRKMRLRGLLKHERAHLPVDAKNSLLWLNRFVTQIFSQQD